MVIYSLFILFDLFFSFKCICPVAFTFIWLVSSGAKKTILSLRKVFKNNLMYLYIQYMFIEDKRMNVFYPTDFLQGKNTYENLIIDHVFYSM